MNKQNFIYMYFFALLTCYFGFVWAPQFMHSPFSPSIMTMPLKGIGMDLYAMYCSAHYILQGYSARIFNPSHLPIYPYPIGGAIQSYGALATMIFVPLAFLPFHFIYVGWAVIAVSILLYLSLSMRNLCFDGVAQNNCQKYFIAFIIFMSLLIFSGPINLLLERGQLEIIIPFLLYLVWRDYVNQKESTKTALLLGLAIHIKVWPMALAAIFLRNKKIKLLIITILVPIILNVIFMHWLPLSELIRSSKDYANASSQMVGWINDSLYSLLSVVGIHLKWKILSIAFYALMGIITLFFLSSHYKDEKKCRNLIFAFLILYSILTPAFTCDYVLVSLLVVGMCFMDAYPSKIVAILLAIAQSCLFVAFHSYAGPIKVVCMLLVLIVIFVQLIQQKNASAIHSLKNRPSTR